MARLSTTGDNFELYLALTGPNGKVTGTVVAKGYEDQIDIFDWSWGADLSQQWSEAAGKQTNRVESRNLVIKKRLDRASTVLMSGAANLSTFPKAVITLLHRVEHEVKLTVTLQRVRIAKYDLTVKDTDDAVTMDETIELTFQDIGIEYTARMRDADPSKGGATIGPMSFDLKGT